MIVAGAEAVAGAAVRRRGCCGFSRGYTPDLMSTRPVLTEDDYLLGIGDLQGALPPDLADYSTPPPARSSRPSTSANSTLLPSCP